MWQHWVGLRVPARRKRCDEARGRNVPATRSRNAHAYVDNVRAVSFSEPTVVLLLCGCDYAVLFLPTHSSTRQGTRAYEVRANLCNGDAIATSASTRQRTFPRSPPRGVPAHTRLADAGHTFCFLVWACRNPGKGVQTSQTARGVVA